MDSNASFEDLCSNPAFAMLMDNLGAGVVVYSADGGILFANSVMVNWRNIPRQEYMKRNVHDFIPDIDVCVFDMACQQKRPVSRLQYYQNLQQPGGPMRTRLTTCTPIFDGDGTIKYVLTLLQDVDDYQKVYSGLLKKNEILHTERPSIQEEKPGMVAESPVIRQLLSVVDNLAPMDSTVLLCGESGTGKEVFARYIHEHSSRSDKPMITVNCAAIPEHLLEAELFGYEKHPFTGVDYVAYYKELFEAEGCEPEFIFANDCRAVLPYTKNVLCCDIHTRERSRRRLLAAGAEKVLTLADIMNAPVDGSGYNEQYGLYGSNKATEDTVKLFPRDCNEFVKNLQESLAEATGVKMNCMIYGDGAFKDPVGKIWELADPVVSPAYTERLEGTPNELKLKYLADNDFKDLKGEELTRAMKEKIEAKDGSLKGSMASQGTTPRRLTDLIGSLCDLTSGSGDKGTPVVFIQGYFDTFAEQ